MEGDGLRAEEWFSAYISVLTVGKNGGGYSMEGDGLCAEGCAGGEHLITRSASRFWLFALWLICSCFLVQTEIGAWYIKSTLCLSIIFSFCEVQIWARPNLFIFR